MVSTCKSGSREGSLTTGFLERDGRAHHRPSLRRGASHLANCALHFAQSPLQGAATSSKELDSSHLQRSSCSLVIANVKKQGSELQRSRQARQPGQGCLPPRDETPRGSQNCAAHRTLLPTMAPGTCGRCADRDLAIGGGCFTGVAKSATTARYLHGAHVEID